MISRAATLILTHPTPDLDAIGFVYSARKVWGPAVTQPLTSGALPTR